MKTLHYFIITIVFIITISMVWYFTSYDPTPVTTENNFGIHALVIHSPPYMACPTEDCQQHEYYLKVNSKLKTFLVGYNICDGNSCVKQDGLAISLPLVDVLHPDYQKLPLPNSLPWKDGDSINIQVKVPNSFIFDNATTFDSTHVPKIWVDLGESEIVRSS
jgi:hypothetical protein